MNNKVFKIYALVLLFCSPIVGYTQSKKAVKYYSAAIQNLQNRNFDLAIENFKKAVDKDSEFADAHYQLGILNKNYLRNVKQVKYHFSKVLEIDSNYKNPAVIRIIAEIYLHEGNYITAKRYLSKYITFKSEPKNFLNKSALLIKQCNYALENIKHPVEINPKRLPEIVNRHNKQYFPVTTADQKYMVFTVRDKIGNKEYEDIYMSRKINGEWGFPESISDNINKPNLNEGTCSISADGKVLAFTICGGKSSGDTDCDLYISYKEGEVWSIPKNMGQNVNSIYWDSQPSLSPDGKVLFFSSNRRGGMGEEDIWMVRADVNGNWGTPLNMGDIINTPGREVAPFIHPSMSTLYFSSDFHPGFGSFDLFVSYKDSVNWSEPKNLGYPINTHLEESSIFITSDCKKAYYSGEAATESGGNDRYFLYEFNLPKEAACKQASTYANGTIFDADTKLPISANVELINLGTYKAESILKSDAVNGDYLVVLNEDTYYGLFVTKQGYLFKSHAFDFETEKTFDPVNLDVYLEPIKKGSLITLNNIFFKTGEYKLESKSAAELDKLVDFLNQNIQLKVEISGHTDNVGQKTNNLKLSNKRAESVVDYLVENGIEAQRITYKGYGDIKPVASNEEEETRKLNRRIECKIL